MTIEVIEIKPPSPPTLRKYGITAAEWWEIWKEQGQVCPICKKAPSTGRTVIDHLHFKGFKKLHASEKKKYIRGVCCWYCNRYYLSKGISIEKSDNTGIYLRKFEDKLKTIEGI